MSKSLLVDPNNPLYLVTGSRRIFLNTADFSYYIPIDEEGPTEIEAKYLFNKFLSIDRIQYGQVTQAVVPTRDWGETMCWVLPPVRAQRIKEFKMKD